MNDNYYPEMRGSDISPNDYWYNCWYRCNWAEAFPRAGSITMGGS